MHRRFRWAGLLAAGLLLGGCVTNPATQQQEFTLVTEAQEIELGRQAHKEITKQFGVYQNPALEEFVAGVGTRIAAISHRKHLPYRFTVLDSPIVNAFAVPGGGIYVTRGLLANLDSEAELAAVLAHETGHVTARHGAQAATRALSYRVISDLLIPLDQRLAGLKPISDVTAGLIFLRYGREAEYQADQLGVEYAYEASYDPRWLGAFLRSLAAQDRGRGAPPEFLSTHPSTPKRIARVDDLAAGVMASGSRNLEVGARRYKERLEGLIYGPGPLSWVWSG
ncbi:MAG: M48 family metalloprotease, partial [Nitrospinota bacterium]